MSANLKNVVLIDKGKVVGGDTLRPHLIISATTGATVIVKKLGKMVIRATETSTGVFECDVPEFGTWVVNINGTDGVSVVIDKVKIYQIGTNTKEPRDITNELSSLSQAIAEQDLEKYGYKIGDYFLGTEQTPYVYTLADMDTFYGGYVRNAVVNTHHVSVIVNTGTNKEWLASGETFAGYNGSTLHSYLSGTVLDNIKADMIALFGGTTGIEHLISHSNLLSTSVSASDWFTNIVCALSENQIYGCNFWSKKDIITEAYKKLELFNRYNINLMFGDNLVWLRDFKDNDTVNACSVYRNGSTAYDSVTNSRLAVGLILLK